MDSDCGYSYSHCGTVHQFFALVAEPYVAQSVHHLHTVLYPQVAFQRGPEHLSRLGVHLLKDEQLSALAVDVALQAVVHPVGQGVDGAVEVVQRLRGIAQLAVGAPAVVEGLGQEEWVALAVLVVAQDGTDGTVRRDRHIGLVGSLDAEQAVVHAGAEGRVVHVVLHGVQDGACRVGGDFAQAVGPQQAGRVGTVAVAGGKHRQHGRQQQADKGVCYLLHGRCGWLWPVCFSCFRRLGVRACLNFAFK